jgi:hypothetical protein
MAKTTISDEQLAKDEQRDGTASDFANEVPEIPEIRTFKTPGDFHIIRAANEGDYQPLIEELRKRADKLSMLAADIIEGKLKRPSERQKRLSKTVEYLMIAKRVDTLMETNGGVEKVAKVEAATEFNCHPRTVDTAIKEAKKFYKEIEEHMGSMANERVPMETHIKLIDELSGELNRWVARLRNGK